MKCKNCGWNSKWQHCSACIAEGGIKSVYMSREKRRGKLEVLLKHYWISL